MPEIRNPTKSKKIVREALKAPTIYQLSTLHVHGRRSKRGHSPAGLSDDLLNGGLETRESSDIPFTHLSERSSPKNVQESSSEQKQGRRQPNTRIDSALRQTSGDPLLPLDSGVSPREHPSNPSSDLIFSIIRLASDHYSERNQLYEPWEGLNSGANVTRANPNRSTLSTLRRSASKNVEDTGKAPASSASSDRPACPAPVGGKEHRSTRKSEMERVNLFKAFDASAATAISMIAQELVIDSLKRSLSPRDSTTAPALPVTEKNPRPKKGSTRYTSPSETLDDNRRRRELKQARQRTRLDSGLGTEDDHSAS